MEGCKSPTRYSPAEAARRTRSQRYGDGAYSPRSGRGRLQGLAAALSGRLSSRYFSQELRGSSQPVSPRVVMVQAWGDPVAQALPVWFELRPIDGTQAEACATQDCHTPQHDSTRQADIVKLINQLHVRCPV